MDGTSAGQVTASYKGTYSVVISNTCYHTQDIKAMYRKSFSNCLLLWTDNKLVGWENMRKWLLPPVWKYSCYARACYSTSTCNLAHLWLPVARKSLPTCLPACEVSSSNSWGLQENVFQEQENKKHHKSICTKPVGTSPCLSTGTDHTANNAWTKPGESPTAPNGRNSTDFLALINALCIQVGR